MNKLNTLITVVFLIIVCISFKVYTNMKVLEIHLIEENQQLKFRLNMKATEIIDPLEEIVINNKIYSKYYMREDN